MKNFVVGLLAMVGLAIAGLILYGVGSLIVGLIGIVVTVVVSVARMRSERRFLSLGRTNKRIENGV